MDIYIAHCYFVVLFVISFGIVLGHEGRLDSERTIDHESHLYFHLIDDHHYVKYIRPASSINDSVLVRVDANLVSVQALDEEKQILHSTVFLVAYWSDHRLSWNLSEYGGIDSFTLPSFEIWTPDLKLLYSHYGAASDHTVEEAARVSHNGSVVWTSHLHVSSHCPLDITEFPFDSHLCQVQLVAGTYSSKQINFQFMASDKHQHHETLEETVVESNMWKLVAKTKDRKSRSMLHQNIFDYISLNVELQRLSPFYHCVVTGPAILVCLLVPVVFLLPVESATKATFGVGLLLTLSVCLKIVVDILGNGRSSAPRIAIFYVTSMALTSISIIVGTVVMATARRGHAKKVPLWLNTIFMGRCGLRRWLCMEPLSDSDHTTPFATMKNSSDFPEHDIDVSAIKECDCDLKEVTKSLRLLLGKCSAAEELRFADDEWMEMARIADRLLFIVFVVLFMLTTISLLG